MWRKLIRAWQRNKQFWSQNENSLLQGQKFNSRRLNQLWKAFLSSVVEAETFHCLWRRNLKVHILCNSAIDFFWVVKLSRVPDAQWIGTGFVRRSFIHYFVQCSVFWLCLFTATELISFVVSFETTRNLVTSTFLRWLWICCCVVFVCLFYWTRYHTDLEQMLKKNRPNIRQNGHWKLETSLKVGLQREGAHNPHSETVINWIRQFFWEKTTITTKFWQ